MDAALWVGPVIVAAFIAGLINVAGWFVTFRHARKLERARRAEKVIDIQTALLAEIRSDLKTLAAIRVAEEVANIKEKLYEAPENEPYTPFVPRDSGTPVFSAIITDIAVLPTDIIDPVILYYRQRDVAAHFTEDLRAPSFPQLRIERKLAMMEDYLGLKAHAGVLAAGAVSALERSLGLPLSLNNKASDPSDPKSASAVSAASDRPSSFSVLL